MSHKDISAEQIVKRLAKDDIVPRREGKLIGRVVEENMMW
jgi:transcriptional regulator CtsR